MRAYTNSLAMKPTRGPKVVVDRSEICWENNTLHLETTRLSTSTIKNNLILTTPAPSKPQESMYRRKQAFPDSQEKAIKDFDSFHFFIMLSCYLSGHMM